MWILVPETQQGINSDQMERIGIDKEDPQVVTASTASHDYVLFRGTREECAKYIGLVFGFIAHGRHFFNGKIDR